MCKPENHTSRSALFDMIMENKVYAGTDDGKKCKRGR